MRAKVTSIEGIESFRASLIVYLEKAGRVLDEISDDVSRTKFWLESNQRESWERELRHRRKQLEEKEAELFSAKLSNLHDETQVQHMAAQKARRAVEEAGAKLNVIKQWHRQYEHRVEPLARDVDKLRDLLSSHMGKAVFYLDQTIKTLNAYAELKSPGLIAGEPGQTSAGAPESEAKKS